MPGTQEKRSRGQRLIAIYEADEEECLLTIVGSISELFIYFNISITLENERKYVNQVNWALNEQKNHLIKINNEKFIIRYVLDKKKKGGSKNRK